MWSISRIAHVFDAQRRTPRQQAVLDGVPEDEFEDRQLRPFLAVGLGVKAKNLRSRGSGWELS